LAKARSFLDKLKTEQHYYKYHFNEKPLEFKGFSAQKTWSSSLVLKFMADVEYQPLADRLAYHKDYPLNFWIKDLELLDDTETKFVQSTYSHVDFLIYSTIDNSPVHAIEVDGYAYHDLNPEQLDQDEITNSILTKLNIPFDRFSTKASNKRERLTQILKQWESKI